MEVSECRMVADSPVARIMYYLYCVNRCVPNAADIFPLLYHSQFDKYQSFDTHASRHALIRIATDLNPRLFQEKNAFFVSDGSVLVSTCPNYFVPYVSLRTQLPEAEVSDEIVIAGKNLPIIEVMVLRQTFIDVFYYKSLRELRNRNETVTIIEEGPQLHSDSTVRVTDPVLKGTNNRAKFIPSPDDVEKDSIMWYMFLTIISAVILLLVSVAIGNNGLVVTHDGHRIEFSLWRSCTEAPSSSQNCSKITSSDFDSDSLDSDLKAARGMFLGYPVLGLSLVIISLLKFWDRRSRKHTGRVIRVVLSAGNCVYIFFLCFRCLAFFRGVSDSLGYDNSVYGMALVLPWGAWILSAFHVLVSAVWCLRSCYSQTHK